MHAYKIVLLIGKTDLISSLRSIIRFIYIPSATARISWIKRGPRFQVLLGIIEHGAGNVRSNRRSAKKDI